MLEAINKAQEDWKSLWFRPVSWKGIRTAYAISEDGGVMLVPTSRGGARAMFPGVSECLEKWEVVTPDTVLSGK